MVLRVTQYKRKLLYFLCLKMKNLKRILSSFTLNSSYSNILILLLNNFSEEQIKISFSMYLFIIIIKDSFVQNFISNNLK